MDQTEVESEPLHAGTSGPHFCAWCRDNWSVYQGMGGVCELLAMVPIILSHEDPVLVSATFPATLRNAMGSVHGGLSSMLLDEVGGLAVCCQVGIRYLRGTRQLDVTFLKRAMPGDVVAQATVLRRDETAIVVDIELVQAEVPIARARGTYAIRPPGQPRVPEHLRQTA